MKKYFALAFGVLLILGFALEAKAELETAASRLGVSRINSEKLQKRKLEKTQQLPGQDKYERIGVSRQEKIKAYKPVLLDKALSENKSEGPKFAKPQPFRAEGQTRLSGVDRIGGIERVKIDIPQMPQNQKPNKITTGNIR